MGAFFYTKDQVKPAKKAFSIPGTKMTYDTSR
jgi:hypothetical protein